MVFGISMNCDLVGILGFIYQKLSPVLLVMSENPTDIIVIVLADLDGRKPCLLGYKTSCVCSV